MDRPIIVSAERTPLVAWRPGVRTRLHAVEGARPTALCIIEQWSDPGMGAPTHTHFDVEEMIVVAAGEAEVWIDGGESAQLAGGDSVLFAAHSWHGFRNVGDGTLHTIAVLAAGNPRVCYQDESETVLEIGGRGSTMLDPHRAVVKAETPG